jgi:hypothetical protein
MNLKEKFDVSELKTEYAYSQKIKAQLNNGVEDRLAFPLLWRIIDYTEYLHKTKLTPELVEKLFKRVEKQPRNTMTRYILGVDGFADGDGFILGFDGKKWFTNSCSHIKTLADLARLTAAKPILLA